MAFEPIHEKRAPVPPSAMKRSQMLSSGLTVRQDFRDSVRFVMFETGYEGWEYATDGGTAFLVSFRGTIYALTCRHVLKNFEYRQLVITHRKSASKGGKIAGIAGVLYPSSPTGAAVDSDILDVCVVKFVAEVDADFFESSAYIVDKNTITTSQEGHRLLVAGALKDKSSIIEPDIKAGFCLLEYKDNGVTTSDPTVRNAIAEFRDPEFNSITGLSGAPVYDHTANALCGMVVRGGMVGSRSMIYYIDMSDIYRVLDAAHHNLPTTAYTKGVIQKFRQGMVSRG